MNQGDLQQMVTENTVYVGTANSNQFFIDGVGDKERELFDSVEELFSAWYSYDDRVNTVLIYRVDADRIVLYAELYTNTEERGDNHEVIEYGIITMDGEVTLFETELKKN